VSQRDSVLNRSLHGIILITEQSREQRWLLRAQINRIKVKFMIARRCLLVFGRPYETTPLATRWQHFPAVLLQTHCKTNTTIINHKQNNNKIYIYDHSVNRILCFIIPGHTFSHILKLLQKINQKFNSTNTKYWKLRSSHKNSISDSMWHMLAFYLNYLFKKYLGFDSLPTL
jgi:hypothetical protein